MTLLIGTVSKSNIVLTADGLSRTNPQTGAGISAQDIQKIFPVSNLPIAIVHHGLNILDGRQVDQFVNDFIEEAASKIGSLTIEEIASELSVFSEKAAKKVLSDPTNQGVVGFWIAGFGHRKAIPELYEVCWPDATEPTRHYPIVLGGDGKDYVKCFLSQPLASFRPDLVKECSVRFACQYHQAIYSQAKAKQSKSGATVFGGHQHQLAILKDGWKWTKTPKTIN